jgi:hypothetical protein
MADLSEGIISHGLLRVNLNCGVDLDKGVLHCPYEWHSDFKITKDDAGIYLSPINGAAVSATCNDSPRSENRLRIDGFGFGYDTCVHTHDGRVSHVFLVNDVEHASPEITIEYVTRKK